MRRPTRPSHRHRERRPSGGRRAGGVHQVSACAGQRPGTPGPMPVQQRSNPDDLRAFPYRRGLARRDRSRNAVPRCHMPAKPLPRACGRKRTRGHALRANRTGRYHQGHSFNHTSMDCISAKVGHRVVPLVSDQHHEVVGLYGTGPCRCTTCSNTRASRRFAEEGSRWTGTSPVGFIINSGSG